jgi:hypothetical protein
VMNLTYVLCTLIAYIIDTEEFQIVSSMCFVTIVPMILLR